MENSHPQHSMSDQGFRPTNFLPLPVPAMAPQHHPSSSANTALFHMPPLPYHQDPNIICPVNDGYIWVKYGQQIIPGWGSPTSYYVCTWENCGVKKSVGLNAEGQIVETVFGGSHNHPRPSERLPRDGAGGYGPCSQGFVAPEVHAAGTSSMPTTGEAVEVLGSSSDSEEEDDGQQRGDGDVAGASATERHVVAPAEGISVRTRGGTSHRKSKSKVWDEFTSVFRDGKIHCAVCNHCEKSLSGKTTGGTSHLRRHLKTCPARPATGPLQQQRSSHPNSSVENSNFDQEKSNMLLTKALVYNLCPFSLTSSKKFTQFLAGICPTYDMATQATIGEKFLSIFHEEKLKLEEELSLAPGGVFLTVARWGLESKYFVCVMAHFVDKEWSMIRKIIRCRFVGVEKEFDSEYCNMLPDYQSYQNVIVWNSPEEEEDVVQDKEVNAQKTVEEIVQNWSLEGKIFGISLPKSINDETILGLQKNITEQNYLLVRDKLLSLPCIIDSLHDLFECTSGLIIGFYSTCWFNYMTCTSERAEKYKEILAQLQIKRPSFGSQKWHVRFFLLEAALLFNQVFPDNKQPSSRQLEATENFCNLARLIYHAIEVITNPRNATLNLYFSVIWSLKIHLMSASRKANIGEVFNPQKMNDKFDNLWMKWYVWLCLAVALDPRYKIRFLDTCFAQAFGNDGKRYTKKVLGKIYELFFRYTFHPGQQSGECLNDAHGSVPIHDNTRELNLYLEGECIPENVPFDILKWWKDNASAYPTLARLARDILAIPACAVSAESAFDKTDERVSLFNRKLSPEIVEALICTQDWIKSSEINEEPVEA